MAATSLMTSALTPAENLKARLAESAASGQVMFGHHDDPVYGHTWNGEEGRSDVKETVGAYPAVMSWDLGGIENSDANNLDGVSFDRMRREIAAQDVRGGVNTFSWHLRNAVTDADSWTTADSLAVSRLVNTEEGRAAYMRQLDRLADFFLSLNDAEGNRIGVIFRPWHEHTGGWFWWGAPNCSVNDYKALWTMMRERFNERGVDNVVWAYSPDRCQSVAQYMERYPGDEYVDILGADVYHFNGSEGLAQYMADATRTLNIAAREAKKRGKIVAFTETGSESLPMAGWYTEVLLPILKANPVCYVTVWRNAHDKPNHFYTPWPGHPAANDFKEFYHNPVTKFAK